MIALFIVAIPLGEFDQQKLETLMRRIPTALVRTENVSGVEKKFYSYPATNDQGFKIQCEADHYLNSPLPSKSSCTLQMLSDYDERFDEHKVEIKNPAVATKLFGAMSFGPRPDTRRMYSNERVYGLGLNGRYQENFRFSFSCTTEKCLVTMSTAKPKPFLENE
jgi:hypothetical protein